LFDVKLLRTCHRFAVIYRWRLQNGVAFKKRKTNICCCFFGEGAARGEFHEDDLAALWKVPVYLSQNNLYAMGTAIQYSQYHYQVEKKGQYGIDHPACGWNGFNSGNELFAAKCCGTKVEAVGNPIFWCVIPIVLGAFDV
jgi:TPP-dependent pyruvate/acetoin dehydrogenase alpha subunit